jgi:hypothetical protein
VPSATLINLSSHMTASRVKDGGEDAPGEMESLLAPVDPSLYATYRPTRDVAWAIAYLAYMGSLLIGGVYAYQHYDVTAFSRMDSDYLAVRSSPRAPAHPNPYEGFWRVLEGSGGSRALL